MVGNDLHMRTHQKKLGMALGGGGSRCFAHLGVLQELRDAGIEPQLLVASSTGAMMASLVANGVSIDAIKQECYRMGTRLKWFIPNGLLTFSQRAVRDILSALLPQRHLERSRTPLVLMGTDVRTGDELLLERGDIIEAVCASCSHPAVHRPVRVGRRLVFDGGILDNSPADICRQRVGADNIVVTCSLDGPMDHDIHGITKFGLLLRSVYIPALRLRQDIIHQYSDLLFEPLKSIKFNFHHWRQILNFHDVPLMEHWFDLGRREARRRLPALQSLLGRG